MSIAISNDITDFSNLEPSYHVHPGHRPKFFRRICAIALAAAVAVTSGDHCIAESTVYDIDHAGKFCFFD